MAGVFRHIVSSPEIQSMNNFFNKFEISSTLIDLRIIWALCFSFFFILMPWATIRGENPDTQNYLERIETLSNSPQQENFRNFPQWVASEPLWRFILVLIGKYFNEPIHGLLAISFICIFIYMYFMSEKVNVFVCAIFLINPLLINLVSFQNRSALAMALCLAALMVQHKISKLLLVLMASLTHSAAFIILIVYYFSRYLAHSKNDLNLFRMSLIALVCALFLSVILTEGREIILSAIGDRRAEYSARSSSFMFLGYWIFLSLCIVFTRREDYFKDSWIDFYLIIMLSLPFFMRIFSGEGVRFIALSIPLLACAIWKRPKPVRDVLLLSFICYECVQYLYWADLL